MKRTSAEILDYYDEQVVNRISEKYGFTHMEAFRTFVKSKAYKMLADAEYEMWDFGTPAIFDMWENEQVTGSITTSVYLRGQQNE